jgi:hypothetical protein
MRYDEEIGWERRMREVISPKKGKTKKLNCSE